MIKKNWDYIVLLILFLLAIFGSYVDSFLVNVNPNLSVENIAIDYNKSLEKNYNDLMESLDFLQKSNLQLIVSKIKYRDVYNFTKEITIYKGFKDGINIGDAVLTNEGLIGVVKRAFDHSAVVELITNFNSNISVKINDTYGILKMSDNGLIVSEISNYDNINPGDLIYTSGIGNLNGNIYIGKVKNINLNITGIEKIVTVEIGANINSINYLFVMVNK